jgi:hypothetical protein
MYHKETESENKTSGTHGNRYEDDSLLEHSAM